jgi:nitrogen fixation/metabolism regulation signal transduction histidine kinase
METLRGLGLAVLMFGAVWHGHAQTPGAGPGIYTCVDERGRKLTSDRPIPECANREQRVLNRDGSVRATQAPAMTAEEVAAQEARDRAAAAARAARADAIRRDRNLLMRYPNEAAHVKARTTALDELRKAIRNTEARTKELQLARKPLLDEAEFYVGKPIPPKLRSAMDANEAATAAQREAATAQQAELKRVNAVYDVELSRLK